MTDHQLEADEDRRSRSRDCAPQRDDPDAPGAFIDDDQAAEVPEPNEPA